MIGHVSFHVRERTPLPDGTYRAISLEHRAPHSVMAWAGRIRGEAADKTGIDIKPGDYVCRQIISVCGWRAVWEYFEHESDFRNLADTLRGIVERDSR